MFRGRDTQHALVETARDHSSSPRPYKNLERGIVIIDAEPVGGVPIYDPDKRFQNRGRVTFDNTVQRSFGVFADALPAIVDETTPVFSNGPITGAIPSVTGLFPAFDAEQIDGQIQSATDWKLPHGTQNVADRVAGVVLPGVDDKQERKIFYPNDIVTQHRGQNLPNNSTLIWDQEESERFIQPNSPLHRATRVTFIPDRLSGGGTVETSLAANYLTQGVVRGLGPYIINGPGLPGANPISGSAGGGAANASTGGSKVVQYWPMGMNGPLSPGKGASDEHIFDTDRDNIPHVPGHMFRDYVRFGPAPQERYPWAPFEWGGLAEPEQRLRVKYRADIVYDPNKTHPNPRGRNATVQGRWVVEYTLNEEPPKPPVDRYGDPIDEPGVKEPQPGNTTGGGGGPPGVGNPPAPGPNGGGPAGGGPDGAGDVIGNIAEPGIQQGPIGGSLPPVTPDEFVLPDGEPLSDPVGNWSKKRGSGEPPAPRPDRRSVERAPTFTLPPGADESVSIVPDSAEPVAPPDPITPVPLVSYAPPYGPLTYNPQPIPNNPEAPSKSYFRVKSLGPSSLVATVLPTETLRKARFDAEDSIDNDQYIDQASYSSSIVPFGDSTPAPSVYRMEDNVPIVAGGFVVLPPGMRPHEREDTDTYPTEGVFALRPEVKLSLGTPQKTGIVTDGLQIETDSISRTDVLGDVDSSAALDLACRPQIKSNASDALVIGDPSAFPGAFNQTLEPVSTLAVDARVIGSGLTENFDVVSGVNDQVGLAVITLIGREVAGQLYASRRQVLFDVDGSSNLTIYTDIPLPGTTSTMSSLPTINVSASGSALRVAITNNTGVDTTWIVTGTLVAHGV